MIFYVAHWDWILLESRGNLINNIKNKKFAAICPIENNEKLLKYYEKTIDWRINREKLFDLKSIYNLRKILKNLPQNSTLHVFTLKSGIIFSISNFFIRKNLNVILSITGLGYLFSKNKKSLLLRTLLKPFLSLLFNYCFKKIIYQNLDDCEQFNNYSKFKNDYSIVESSGIEIKNYEIKKNINKKLKIISASRLLRDKGILDFLNLSNNYIDNDIEFYLAGDLDPGNPQNITDEELFEIKNSKNLNFIGFIDLKKELYNFDVFISLSKYEGFSRSLLEAAYSGLYVISFENNGSKFISKFENSLLIQQNDYKTLNSAISYAKKNYKFISINNRKFIEENYSSKNIGSKFNDIYEDLR